MSIAAATIAAVAIGFTAGSGTTGTATTEDPAPAAEATPDLDVTPETVDIVRDAFDRVLEPVTPTDKYFAAVWGAREAVMVDCMTAAGHEWRIRPNEAASPTARSDWPEWQAWFDSSAAADPAFETTAFGDDDTETNVGGCQRAAYFEVHGPGEEAYSKAANLMNGALAEQVTLLDAELPVDAASAEQGATIWADENAADIDAIADELAAELDHARTVTLRT